MTRHSFIWSLLAMVLAPLGLRIPETPPRLWGDGVHDDSYALQWRIDRATAQNPFVLRNGTFALDRGIILRHPYSIDWVDNVFRGTAKFHAHAARDVLRYVRMSKGSGDLAGLRGPTI